MTSETLQITDLAFAYDAKKPVLSGVSFKLPAGSLLTLAGANGSGKSTLVAILAGLLEPLSGEIRWGASTGRQAYESLRTQSALLPQNIDHWLLGETGREDLYLASSQKADALYIEELIAKWNLTPLLDCPVETLSLGQKKRLSLVAALAQRPQLILFDEPFSGLDWPGSLLLIETFKQLKSWGTTLILSTHEPSLLSPLTDYWLLLAAEGRWAFGANLEDRFTDFSLRPLC